MEEKSYEVEIPCYFLCPISIQLMKDPVTVSTGITYDRQNIEKWLFSCKNTTCPVTKLEISAADLTPNHTLRRLIQAWCTLNSHERIPTPKAPVDRSHILKIIHDAKNDDSPHSQLNCLRRLRSIAHRDGSSRNQMQAAGAVDFLSSIVRNNNDAVTRDEALDILQKIELSDTDLKKISTDNGDFLRSLMHVVETGNCQSRTHAVTILKSAFNVADPEHLIGCKPEIFKQITQILADKISPQATKSALQLLVEICPWGRNRIKAAEAGAVTILIEMLLETSEKRSCELIMVVLEQLCGCAEGRAELLRHGAGLAVVSKKILRVSNTVSERAVRILSSISRHSANSRVVQEMLQVGVVTKLCLVLQVEGSQKIKERAQKILRLHYRAWKGSSCIPPDLISSYPSS